MTMPRRTKPVTAAILALRELSLHHCTSSWIIGSRGAESQSLARLLARGTGIRGSGASSIALGATPVCPWLKSKKATPVTRATPMRTSRRTNLLLPWRYLLVNRSQARSQFGQIAFHPAERLQDL